MKAEYEKDKQIGKIADGAKNIEGDMHIVIRLESPKDDKGRRKYPSVANVIKWRRDPEDERGLPPPAFPFLIEEFEKIHGANYKRARENVAFASSESVEKLRGIMALMDKTVSDEMHGKWIKAAGVESLEFMTQAQVDKCVEFVQKKIQGVKS